MKYFKVIYGYGKDDFFSIPQTELAKGINAQVTGKIALFETGSISGNEIKKILPDYQKEMGWNRDYQLGHEDYAQIGKKLIKEYEDFYLLTKTNLERHLKGLPLLEKLENASEVKVLADKLSIK